MIPAPNDNNIEALQDPGDSIALLDWWDKVIVDSIFEFTSRYFPTDTTITQYALQRYAIDNQLGSNWQEVIVKINESGADQLGAVKMLLTYKQPLEIFSNVESLAIHKSIIVQHIMEVLTDNMDEGDVNLWTAERLQIFIDALKGEISLDEAHQILLNDEEIYHWGEALKFQAGMNPLMGKLLKVLDAGPGDLTENFGANLIYLNLAASKEAIDILDQYTHTEYKYINDLAEGAIDALLNRYIAQLHLKDESIYASLMRDQTFALEIRTHDILTNYTYQAALVARLVGERGSGAFTNICQTLQSRINGYRNVQTLLYPAISSTSLFIRIVNDIGSLSLVEFDLIDHLVDQIEIVAGKHNLTREELLDTLDEIARSYDEKDEVYALAELVYTIVKDISQKESNLSLGIKFTDMINLDKFHSELIGLNSKAAELVTNVLSMQDVFAGEWFNINMSDFVRFLMPFAMYCYDMYRGFDFDGDNSIADARTIAPTLFNAYRNRPDRIKSIRDLEMVVNPDGWTIVANRFRKKMEV